MNKMRTIFEKETIVLDYLSGTPYSVIMNKYNINYPDNLYRWIHSYEKNGIEGLKSKTGTAKGGSKGQGPRKPKNYEEELEMKIMKLEIENARLKKGYLVKGAGETKEFVTTFEKNMK